MSKDTQLYTRAAKMARSLAGTESHAASKVIRALLSRINQQDRELREWREGRAHKALEAENRFLRRMIQQRKEAIGE